MPTKADYAKIAIACKELGIDRKQIIADRYGVDSAKELKPAQLNDLYSHFKYLGWQVEAKAGRGYRPSDDYIHIPDNVPFAGLKRKIIVMHKALGYRVKGLNTRMARQGKVDAFLWCNDEQTLNTIVRDYNKRLRDRDLDPDNL